MENKYRKYLEYVFGFLMAVGVCLCFFLLPLSNSVGSSEEWKEMAETEKRKKLESENMKNTIMGDVYDRNGKVIVTVPEEGGATEYLDDKAYSTTVGFYEEAIGSHLLLKNFKQDLFYSDESVKKGRSLTLTLDADLQEYAYQLICEGEGDYGSVTVLDARDGAILAMAFNPSFSINEMREKCEENGYKTSWNKLLFGENDRGENNSSQISLGSPLTMPQRPGSIYKIVTGIGILENHLETTIVDDLNEGVYKFPDGGSIENSRQQSYGALGFYDGFKYSSNIYFGLMAYRNLGWNQMEELAKRCKVGSEQNYDFGTVLSTFESGVKGAGYDKSQPNTQLAKIAFGYGDIQLTGVHAAMITQGIANKGMMWDPYMVQSVNKTIGYQLDENQFIYEKGEETKSRSYDVSERKSTTLTDEDTAQKMTEAMIGAYKHIEADYGGEDTTQEGLVIDGKVYPIAIKTGTLFLLQDETDFLYP